MTAEERSELAGLLRECGRMDEAEEVESAPEEPSPPAPEQPAPQPYLPPAKPLLPSWMAGVAAAGLVCLVVAIFLPIYGESRRARDLTLCRQRLQRVAFALRLAADAADGRYPAAGVHLATLLAPYQVQPADLKCPSGAVYQFNPQLAGQRQAVVADQPGLALLVEVGPDGQPAMPHRGACQGVLTSGWVGQLDSVARASLTARLPADEPPPAVSRPALSPAPLPAATQTAPSSQTRPAPRPSTIPATQPENPKAAGSASPPRLAQRKASEPQVLSADSTPPETKAWQQVLSLEGHDLATSQPFEVGVQGRVRFETRCNELGPQPFRLVLVDEVGARPLRVLAVGVGPSKGIAEIGAEGRFRVRVISVQPYKLTVEDRR